MIRSVLVLSLAALSMSSAQAGKLVKWVDKDGRVHYSDQEPTETAKSVTHMKKHKGGAPVAAVESPPSAAANVPTLKPQTAAEQAAAFKERTIKKAEAEAEEKKKKDEVAMKEKNCVLAQNQARQLDAGGRFTKAGPNGETLYMDEKDIEQAKVEARQHVDQWCKG